MAEEFPTPPSSDQAESIESFDRSSRLFIRSFILSIFSRKPSIKTNKSATSTSPTSEDPAPADSVRASEESDRIHSVIEVDPIVSDAHFDYDYTRPFKTERSPTPVTPTDDAANIERRLELALPPKDDFPPPPDAIELRDTARTDTSAGARLGKHGSGPGLASIPSKADHVAFPHSQCVPTDTSTEGPISRRRPLSATARPQPSPVTPYMPLKSKKSLGRILGEFLCVSANPDDESSTDEPTPRPAVQYSVALTRKRTQKRSGGMQPYSSGDGTIYVPMYANKSHLGSTMGESHKGRGANSMTSSPKKKRPSMQRVDSAMSVRVPDSQPKIMLAPNRSGTRSRSGSVYSLNPLALETPSSRRPNPKLHRTGSATGNDWVKAYIPQDKRSSGGKRHSNHHSSTPFSSSRPSSRKSASDVLDHSSSPSTEQKSSASLSTNTDDPDSSSSQTYVTLLPNPLFQTPRLPLAKQVIEKEQSTAQMEEAKSSSASRNAELRTTRSSTVSCGRPSRSGSRRCFKRPSRERPRHRLHWSW
ncbi:hypothetical protein BU26DRAFT_601185 [Trematosphaeria pertusa]|uniref:Uncharacterized protein n=1 Tax=Trematosphaeria pertusa TaxID=390896 RepID=A0A6A6IRG7_9PLEO|nr:uncharacterized protein BU26DRAFT_601185 [Trematosphaeria pertusa]KAF2252976.1 hypothetical protein BU26DRAFT_601185 [Trematosphaeria pertusa]